MVSLHGLSSMATQAVLRELTQLYADQTGIHATITSMGGVEVAQRVRRAEALDVVVLAAHALKPLASEGHILSDSCVAIASSAMAVAIPFGAPSPAIHNAEAVKAAILAARAIGYSTGPSGTHLLALLETWGIAGTVSAKLRRAPAGTPVAALLASGQVDLGFQQLSELLNAPGIQVLGRLPTPIQAVTIFAAGVTSTSRHRPAACALIHFLASPGTAAVKRRLGMEPTPSS